MAIFRGDGGAGDANTDITINQVTEKASEASDSATAAASSATSASTSASNASTSETNASNSATAAASSASAASTSETNASTSASTASTQASNASTFATAASTAQTAAETAQTAAETAETNAETAETNASTSATTATTKASEASTSATNAATSATTATTKASEASTSASNAASSESAAASSATAAQAAEDAALAALDNFDDRYLGVKTSDPTVDNDGDALVAGALYYNSTDEVMKVYEGSSWVAAYASLSGTLIASNNLSDLTNATTARSNLGLGTAATTASTDYATAAQGTTADSALQNVVEDTTPQLGGNLDTQSFTVDGRDVSTDGTKLDGIATNATANPNAIDNVVEDTTPQLGGDLASNGNDVLFADNDKAQFGAGSDLQIYHDGSNSYVKENGVGNFYIQGQNSIRLTNSDGTENYAVFNVDGAVQLNHDNTTRLLTTATGVDVTGGITTSGAVDVNGNELILDADGDTSITADTDDQIDIKVGGTDYVTINADGVTITDTDSGDPRLLLKNTSDGTGSAFLDFQKDSASPANDNLGIMRWIGDDDGGNTAAYVTFVGSSPDVTDGSEDGSFQIQTLVNGTNATRLAIVDGSVGIGTSSPDSGTKLHVEESSASLTSATTASCALFERAGNAGISIGTANTGASTIFFQDTDSSTIGRVSYDHSDNSLQLWSSNAERARINSSGDILIGQNSTVNPPNSNVVGTAIRSAGIILANGNATHSAVFGRTTDGVIVYFSSAGTTEGSISVSGTTVSYNGGHLSRWGRLPDDSKPTILKGTVMSNLDAMVVWNYPDELYTEEDETDNQIPEGKSVGDVKKAAYTAENEQRNQIKVSDTEGDINVAGLFVKWDTEVDGYNDIDLAMTGDMVIRIAQGTTVQRGDLLMSAGDGTAKPQDDDIVRSKTIAKVTSTTVINTYADGSYVVPCVIMAC
jgi:hypothetical protein